jgi:hypothetical protein
LFRYTPTDSIILLYTIETVNHITASSFSQSGLVYSDAVGDVYIVSIYISGLVSKRICIDAGIAISLAFLDDNLITVFQDGSYSLNGNVMEESEMKLGCVLDTRKDYILACDLRGRYNVCKRGKEGEYSLEVNGKSDIDLTSLLNVWAWKLDEDWFVTVGVSGASTTLQYEDGGFVNSRVEFGACVGIFSGSRYGVVIGTEKVVVFGRDSSDGIQECMDDSLIV